MNIIRKFRTVKKNEDNIVVAYKKLTEREVQSAKNLKLSEDEYARMLFLNELLERVTEDPLVDYKVSVYPKYIKRGLGLYGIEIKLIDLQKGENYVKAVGQWIKLIPEEEVEEIPKEDLDSFFTFVEGEELDKLIEEVRNPEYVKRDDDDEFTFGEDGEKKDEDDTMMMFDVDLDETTGEYETGEEDDDDFDWGGEENLPETNTSFLIGKAVK